MTTANLNPPAADQSNTEGNDDSTSTTAQEAITVNDSNAANTYTARMARQTAAVALNAVLTAAPAVDVARLAADVTERDFPAVDYWHVFTTAAEQARALTAAGNGTLIVSAETVSAALQARGQLTDNTRTVLLDAVGTCRGGRALAPTAAAQTLQALKRWRFQQAAAAVAEQATATAATGSDADAVRLLHYAAHLERLAKRAGVIPE